MIPPFNSDGELPPGIHSATWQEFAQRFGTTPYRCELLAGLLAGLYELRRAGCQIVFIDGSFVTAKAVPGDFDVCWDVYSVNPSLLDPILLTFDNGRAAQKAKYKGEFFPAQNVEADSGRVFLDFFQTNKNGNPKGIIALALRRLP